MIDYAKLIGEVKKEWDETTDEVIEEMLTPITKNIDKLNRQDNSKKIDEMLEQESGV